MLSQRICSTDPSVQRLFWASAGCEAARWRLSRQRRAGRRPRSGRSGTREVAEGTSCDSPDQDDQTAPWRGEQTRECRFLPVNIEQCGIASSLMLISNLVCSGDSGGHSPPHQPGRRYTARSFSAEEAESPLHHGRKHRLCVRHAADRLARICVCVSAAGHDRCASVFTQRGATPLCAGSLTSWPTQRLPTSSWTATPVPPTSPLGSSAAGTACLG